MGQIKGNSAAQAACYMLIRIRQPLWIFLYSLPMLHSALLMERKWSVSGQSGWLCSVGLCSFSNCCYYCFWWRYREELTGLCYNNKYYNNNTKSVCTAPDQWDCSQLLHINCAYDLKLYKKNHTNSKINILKCSPWKNLSFHK